MLMLFTQKFSTSKSKEKKKYRKIKGALSRLSSFFVNIANREEKSLPNVVMVAKFLDDNKPKNVT